MADHELFFEVWMPILNYSWGSHECTKSYEAKKLTVLNIDSLAVGMQFDVTF